MVCCQPSLTTYVVGITDLRAFIAPYLKEGHLLEVAAIATRIVSSPRKDFSKLTHIQ